MLFFLIKNTVTMTITFLVGMSKDQTIVIKPIQLIKASLVKNFKVKWTLTNEISRLYQA